MAVSDSPQTTTSRSSRSTAGSRRRRRRPGRPRAAGRAARRSSRRRRRWPSTGRGRKGTPREEREFKIVQASPTLFLPELMDAALPALGDRVRRRADAPAARVLVRPVPRQAAGARARRRCGTRTRATGAATSTIAASPAGCRCTTSTSTTAACTSSTAATSSACSSTASPSTCRATCCICEPRRVASRRVPAPARRRHVPPRQDAAHDAAPTRVDEWRRILTQHLRVGRHRGRRRPLSVEGLRQPVHRRAHHTEDARRTKTVRRN